MQCIAYTCILLFMLWCWSIAAWIHHNKLNKSQVSIFPKIELWQYIDDLSSGPWFRLSNISYPEVSDSLRAVKELSGSSTLLLILIPNLNEFLKKFSFCHQLAASGYICPFEDTTELQEICNLLTVAELREISRVLQKVYVFANYQSHLLPFYIVFLSNDPRIITLTVLHCWTCTLFEMGFLRVELIVSNISSLNYSFSVSKWSIFVFSYFSVVAHMLPIYAIFCLKATKVIFSWEVLLFKQKPVKEVCTLTTRFLSPISS